MRDYFLDIKRIIDIKDQLKKMLDLELPNEKCCNCLANAVNSLTDIIKSLTDEDSKELKEMRETAINNVRELEKNNKK